MFYVYILKSVQSDRFCVGHTNNLSRRLKEHRSGRTTSLKGRMPYRLVYYEMHKNREDALSSEKYFKSGAGRERRLDLIANFSHEMVHQFNVSMGL